MEVFAILSAIQATTQLIEQAFRILGRLRRAHQRQKALVDVLARHESELESIKTIIGIIDDVEELQTSSVGTELVRLKDVQSKLAKFLTELDPKLEPKPRDKVNQFARQLMQGSADERTLSAIMDELVHVKAMLLLRIQVANVGVVRTMEKQLVANAEVIQRIDQYLREQVDDCQGLRIARLLKGRRPSNDGTVPLTLADLRSLSSGENDNNDDDEDSSDETLVDDSDSPQREIPLKTERIILRNTARQQALQINAALGEDIWKELNRLVIKDNVAEDQAVQVNYGIALEAAMVLLNVQDKRIAARK
ncbi:Nn.00g041850.m01.CDS01 [Neocucurbitaria sp. VM-36]